MLATKQLPPHYSAWNIKWTSPCGNPGYKLRALRHTRYDIKKRGPFAFQPNNSTREFEYPWAYESVSKRGPSQTVVDLGGSLGGLQFVLAMEGHTVLNVDPGLKASGLGWNVDAVRHNHICRTYHVAVDLRTEPIEKAKISDQSVDVLLSVSALEHFSEGDLGNVIQELPRILKPDGVAILTVDLFLDLFPFTTRRQNDWGTNIDIKQFLDRSELELASGNADELYGYPDFSAPRVLENLSKYHVGTGYPSLAQCFVAKRRA